jgi:DNA invertase Pin-like site-specific DNA recombinase
LRRKYMSSRYRFKSQEDLQAEEQTTWGPSSLLINDPPVNYARQSKMAMVRSHRVSHELQSKNFIEYAMQLGWQRELIEIYDDTVPTAVLGIKARERLLDLYEDIKSDHIKTVLIYMVDRLFRDEFLTEATRLGKTCSQNRAMLFILNLPVMLSLMMYDNQR